jgi:hypothetical protein
MPEDFASEYDPMQLSAHKDAVSLYTNGGDNATLKDLAVATLPALQYYLEIAQQIGKIASDITGLVALALVARGLFLRGAPAESGRLDSIVSEEGLRVNGALGSA